MARSSKFKFLFELKSNFNGGQVYKEISKFGYFKRGKSQNNIGVAEEIGCKNDIVLRKIDGARKN